MFRHKKFKRGKPLEIIQRFGGGQEDKAIGYYWMNDATNQRFVLVDTIPPLKLRKMFISKRFFYYKMIKEIHELNRKSRVENDGI